MAAVDHDRMNFFTAEEVQIIAKFLDAPLKTIEGVGYLAWFKANEDICGRYHITDIDEEGLPSMERQG